jgi:undecaprenyl-diphosphatase
MKIIQTIHSFDVHWFFWLSQRKSRNVLVQIARWVSKSGDGYLYGILSLVLALVHGTEQRLILLCMGVGFALERPLYLLIKNSCKRDRPQVALNIPSFIIPSDRFSFPSGHTSAAFLIATLLSYFYPILSPLAFVWASSMGLARVVLGVHFPTDTLIGALMGTLLALITLEICLA